MNEFVSPKQVAEAIGVSESSLKRWCDKGLLVTQRTAGGHRRLALNSVIQFLRQTGQPVARPELIGLPAVARASSESPTRSVETLAHALLVGDETQAQTLVTSLYLGGMTCADFCDKVLAVAMHQLGQRWQCGELQIFEERRACQLAIRLLYTLRVMLPDLAIDAPLAMGGTVLGDAYQLPTTMVELVLREIGWNAVSFGTELPISTLISALETENPRLFWLSVSHLTDEVVFLDEYESLYQAAEARQTAVVVGGQALIPAVRSRMRYSSFCDSLRHLVGFANTVRSLVPPR